MRRRFSFLVVLSLIASAAVGGTVPARGRAAQGPCERAGERAPVPVNVELTTVTDTAAAFTWLTCRDGRPHPSTSEVSYQWSGGSGAVGSSKKTPYHFVVVDDLEPGVTYRYTVSSDGIPGAPDRLNPGIFTTLTPPPGRELFSFAVLADAHIGETVSGLATSQPVEFPPSYSSDRPYPVEMLKGAVTEAARGRPAVTLLPADNTTHGERHDLATLRRILRGAGPYLIARGAHDRPDQYVEAKPDCPPDGDCFRAIFRPGAPPAEAPRHLPEARRVRGWTFVALDSVDLSSGNGTLPQDQLDWLTGILDEAQRRKSPVVVFFHHPVSEYSSTLAIPPGIFGVRQDEANAFLQLIGRYDVRLVINAHTHRNWISYSPFTGRMPIVEVGPTKEYPGGYSIIRVYESGLLREWWPIACAFCREWRETTRGEYFSLYPLYTQGSLRERAWTHRFEGPDVPGIPSLPLGLWPPAVAGEA